MLRMALRWNLGRVKLAQVLKTLHKQQQHWCEREREREREKRDTSFNELTNVAKTKLNFQDVKIS